MKPRHEFKHRINYCDMLILRQRLSAVMSRDTHAKDGKYEIRSLYFDNLYDKALREKTDGVNHREKFRIRLYNGDLSLIHLEKKSKHNGLCTKESVKLSLDEVKAIIKGETDCLIDSTRPLLCELRSKMLSEGLMAKTVVDYTREPFVFAPGNVRVTLDYNIRTGMLDKDITDPSLITLPVPDDPIILEVKWDEYLPSIIESAVSIDGRISGAFSKYAACRSYF